VAILPSWLRKLILSRPGVNPVELMKVELFTDIRPASDLPVAGHEADLGSQRDDEQVPQNKPSESQSDDD